MSFDVAHSKQVHHHAGASRYAPHVAGRACKQPLIPANVANATIMPPDTSRDRTSSRYKYRQVTRVFLGGLAIGFALTAATAWSTVFSTRPVPRVKAPTEPAELAFTNHFSSKDTDVNNVAATLVGRATRQDLDLQAPTPPPVNAAPHAAQPPVEQTRIAPYLPPYQSSALHKNGAAPLPARYSHTAIYDIARHTVYMPNGQALEAHSGLGNKLDDPRYAAVKNRGPTPPNVYKLTLRKKLFHKVRAIRLVPIGERSMHGRDGMLAHTYMRGASGESNGCVSIKNYSAFLRAFLKGEVDRLVVVSDISRARWHTVSADTGSQYLDTE
jgi:hypothetical protein